MYINMELVFEFLIPDTVNPTPPGNMINYSL